MPTLPNGTKLANTPMWAIKLSKIAEPYLEQDDRIPNNLVTFFFYESDEGMPSFTVEKNEMTLNDDEFKVYRDIATEIFESNKESIFEEFYNLSK
jgi:hypothetical protein